MYFESDKILIQNIRSGWKEFAVKNIWKYIKDDQDLKDYLPWEEMLNSRFPDKKFVWGILFTVKPDWAK